MSLPSRQEARSRQTAMDAERWFWTSRLKALIDARRDDWLHEESDLLAQLLDDLDALIRERTT